MEFHYIVRISMQWISACQYLTCFRIYIRMSDISELPMYWNFCILECISEFLMYQNLYWKFIHSKISFISNSDIRIHIRHFDIRISRVSKFRLEFPTKSKCVSELLEVMAYKIFRHIGTLFKICDVSKYNSKYIGISSAWKFISDFQMNCNSSISKL